MEILEKYQLGELVRDGSVRTYAGLDGSSGAKVLVHRLTSGRTQVDLVRSIVRRLRDAPPGQSSHILDLFESGGEVYVVTDVIESLADLETWLGSRASEAGKANPEDQGTPAKLVTTPTAVESSGKDTPASSRTVVASAPQSDDITIFENLAEAPRRPRDTAVLRESGTPPSGAITPPSLPRQQQSAAGPKTNAQENPGEFTQLFEAPEIGGRSPASLSAPHFPVEPVGPENPSAGEFTQFFQPSLGDSVEPFADEPAPAIQARSEPHEPGELTRILNSPSSLQESARPGGLDSGETDWKPQESPREQTFTGFFDESHAERSFPAPETAARNPSSTVVLSGTAADPSRTADAELAPKPVPSFPKAPPTPPSPPRDEARREAPEPPIAPKPPAPFRAPAPPQVPTPPQMPTPPKVSLKPFPAPPAPNPIRRPPAPPLKIPSAPAPKAPPLPASLPKETSGTSKPSLLPLVLIMGGLLLGVAALVFALWK